MGTDTPRSEFATHILNEAGKHKAREIGMEMTLCLDRLEAICGKEGREMSLVRTKLEEAGFFAKKAVACRPENQQ
jgi:hypothetical protein